MYFSESKKALTFPFFELLHTFLEHCLNDFGAVCVFSYFVLCAILARTA